MGGADRAERAGQLLLHGIAQHLADLTLEAAHARERIALTTSLLENSNSALDLAHARFGQGLSSIVELNQAELSQVSAEIAHTMAEYDYRLRRDILDFQTGSLR